MSSALDMCPTFELIRIFPHGSFYIFGRQYSAVDFSDSLITRPGAFLFFQASENGTFLGRRQMAKTRSILLKKSSTVFGKHFSFM